MSNNININVKHVTRIEGHGNIVVNAAEGKVEKLLDADAAAKMSIEKMQLDEKSMRWLHNEDAMAVEKLSQGIRGFTADLLKLEDYVQERVMRGAA